MQIYKRNIEKKLFSLRLILIFLVIFGALLFANKNYNVLYLIGVFFVFLNLIVVKDFRVSLNSFEIVKYFFFGLIPISWSFEKTDNITIKSDGSIFGSDAKVPDTDQGNTLAGILFGCLYPIFVRPKIGVIEFSIHKIESNGKVSGKVLTFLNANEFRMAEAIAVKKHGI